MVRVNESKETLKGETMQCFNVNLFKDKITC